MGAEGADPAPRGAPSSTAESAAVGASVGGGFAGRGVLARGQKRFAYAFGDGEAR
ncbi:hypothetical protein [Streptomyces sp. NPDC001507]|uniref:hypothetical protein n=1 Tax=Streptomyces sp. NPDC001507 TaxID=3364579 RepID=UPI00369A748A